MAKSRKPVRKGDRKRRGGPKQVGTAMEHQMTDFLSKIGIHQTFGHDLDNEYATDTMIFGEKGLEGYRHPVLVQLTKSIGAAGKIHRWIERSGKGPFGKRLYVEMDGRVTYAMARALKDVVHQLWKRQSQRNTVYGVTIDARGNVQWWRPASADHGRRKKDRRR